ncbi:hypothetical protein [Shivajiella indica]|uniref:Outer membrane protein beta-barrel domain-containing protein n=1 Tax=Shivajiella indica TaxID=872115 RepID=A0ABW5B9L2_9BACT
MLKREKIKYLVILAVFFALNPVVSNGQESVLDVGIRFQKTVNFYWENGVSIQYSHRNLKPDRLYFGFSYVTSRLGTAINSNAIKQDNFLFNTSWYFRPQHTFRPIVRLNFGYFLADYEEPVFDVLDNTSFLLSPELGAVFESKAPFKVMITLGYNLVTGNGNQGAGTVYPLFVQSTLSWSIFKK